MISPLVTLSAPTAATEVVDIEMPAADFAATTMELKAKTPAGKALFAEMFGAGAVGVTMYKTAAYDFQLFAQRKGLVVR